MLVATGSIEPFLHGDATFAARLHLRRPPGLRARSRWPTSTSSRSEEPPRARRAPTRTRFRATLEKLRDLPIVGDVRGDGYFYGIELVKDKATKETFDDDESERLLRGFLSGALFDAGLFCRADDRGDPVDPAGAAAHLRPGALRRDRADPALGADRGLDPAVIGSALSDRSDRTKVRRLPEKQVSDRAALDAMLDAGLVAHVRPRRRRPAVRDAVRLRARRRPPALARVDRQPAVPRARCRRTGLRDDHAARWAGGGAVALRVLDALPLGVWCRRPGAAPA